MKKLAILALATLIALPASAAGVTIGGYIDIGYLAAEGGTSIGGANVTAQAAGTTNGYYDNDDQFVLSEVNLDLSSQLTNDISAFVSIDSIRGGALAVDYAYVDFANPGPFDLNVRAGRIPSVIGIEQRASESNQTKFITLSLLSPFTVGAYEGVAVYGSFSPVNYALAVTNEDIVGDMATGASMGTAPLLPGNNNGAVNAASLDNNNNVALSGRLGVVPIEGLEIGVSGTYTKWITGGRATTGVASPNLDAIRSLYGVDASYVWGALTLKGEYISAKEEQFVQVGQAGQDIRANGYYVEAIYDLTSKVSLAGRYASVEFEQPNVISDYNTITVAGMYRIADNVSFKAEYDLNREDQINQTAIPSATISNKPKNNVFALSLVGSF